MSKTTFKGGEKVGLVEVYGERVSLNERRERKEAITVLAMASELCGRISVTGLSDAQRIAVAHVFRYLAAGAERIHDEDTQAKARKLAARVIDELTEATTPLEKDEPQ